ncbi:MAG: transcription antitermination factor NusB [Bacteroidota bacterium]
MLNRRILRFKALKALYAYHKTRAANRDWAAERMNAKFEPNWLSETPPRLKELEKQYEEAKTIFLEIVETGKEDKAPASKLGKEAVLEAYQFYGQQVHKDKQRIRKQMLEEAEGIYETYGLVLSLVVALADYAQTDAEARRNKSFDREPVYDNEYKLVRNTWIEKLRALDEFEDLRQRYPLTWEEEKVRTWFRKLSQQPWYETYAALPEASYEEDMQAVDELIRNFIFKDEAIVEFFEERELQWSENRPILRNMLLRTVKNAKKEEDTLALQPLAQNWENDRFFFEELFDIALEEETQNDELITERLKGWELERVALTDRLVLQLALTELLHFQSIPVKVTINEYVELAKNYSPPKSREFINGMLDRLSESLQKEGKLKKSGRGLIDNK